MTTIELIKNELVNYNGINPTALFNKKENKITLGSIILPQNVTKIQPPNKNQIVFYTTNNLILPYTSKQRIISSLNFNIDCNKISINRWNEGDSYPNYTVETLKEFAKQLNIPSMTHKSELVRNLREYLGCD